MDILSIILIGIGLAMDCFAVSITKGVTSAAGLPGDAPKPAVPYGRVTLMALLFGLFQGGMPLIGFFAGNVFSAFFSRYAPWIALALLAFIGGKMIVESLHEPAEDTAPQSAQAAAKAASNAADFSLLTLLLLAVATSIDALATGVIFIPCPCRLWLGVGIIALISFLFSLLGFAIGRVFGKRFHFRVSLLGGIILILIGLKIWAEGLFF